MTTFLLSGPPDGSGSSFPFPVLALESAWNQPFPQEALVPFSREQYLETKLWALRVLITTGLLLPPSTLLVNRVRKYLYYFYIYTFMYYFVSMFISVFIKIDEKPQIQSYSNLTPRVILVFFLAELTSPTARNLAPIILNALVNLLHCLNTSDLTFPWSAHLTLCC